MSKTILGIKIAPLSIPTERRLQTLAVVYHVSTLLIYVYGVNILFFYLLFTNYYYISLLYFTWFWLDHKTCSRGGRRSELMRNAAVWKYMRDYFPIKTIKTAELDPNKNYICGYHPHGIASFGAFLSLATEATGFSQMFDKIKPYLLTLTAQFKFPCYRDYIMSLGLCDVSRESIEWLLTNEGKGNMVTIVIGGALEALDAHPGVVKLTLKRRKGFVRLAIKHGANLIPIFAFGENEIFTQLSNPEGSYLRSYQNFITKLISYSPPVFYGRGVFQYSFGFIPYRRPIDVVIGKPIDVVQNPNPSEEEVTHYHNLYIQSLLQLFNEHKVNYELYKNVSLDLVA